LAIWTRSDARGGPPTVEERARLAGKSLSGFIRDTALGAVEVNEKLPKVSKAIRRNLQTEELDKLILQKRGQGLPLTVAIREARREFVALKAASLRLPILLRAPGIVRVVT